jgi:hypothetical protein
MEAFSDQRLDDQILECIKEFKETAISVVLQIAFFQLCKPGTYSKKVMHLFACPKEKEKSKRLGKARKQKK